MNSDTYHINLQFVNQMEHLKTIWSRYEWY